mmetsp:Transcript_34931/g.42726  ORF Transcript_34931/g.42726 Transcript_34931/m.42726 type:complete len:214 (-) Transcript_34931:1094-1735(-)
MSPLFLPFHLHLHNHDHLIEIAPHVHDWHHHLHLPHLGHSSYSYVSPHHKHVLSRQHHDHHIHHGNHPVVAGCAIAVDAVGSSNDCDFVDTTVHIPSTNDRHSYHVLETHPSGVENHRNGRLWVGEGRVGNRRTCPCHEHNRRSGRGHGGSHRSGRGRGSILYRDRAVVPRRNREKGLRRVLVLGRVRSPDRSRGVGLFRDPCHPSSAPHIPQ